MSRLFLIGIGYRPFDDTIEDIILKGELILASPRLFDVFRKYKVFNRIKERIKVINSIDETIETIRSGLHSVKTHIVLLASGDPMLFGIGRRVIMEFGSDTVEIIPDLSSVQVAFSKIKIPWDDAFLMSIHGGPDPLKRRRLPYDINDIPLLLRHHRKLAILTDKLNNPARIGEVLENFTPGEGSITMYVCERMGYGDERVIIGSPREIKNMVFNDPNLVVVILRDEIDSQSPLFGLTEDEILHTGGLITKDEVRAITIHKLRLPSRGVVWDVGAGSGSVSLEIALFSPLLKVYAIEKDEDMMRNIRDNIDKFNTWNVMPVHGEAPYVFDKIERPHRVFIGGSGGRLGEIIEYISDIMPQGIIIINATMLETMNTALSLLRKYHFSVDLTEVNVSRMKSIGTGSHLSSLNPVFIIRGMR